LVKAESCCKDFVPNFLEWFSRLTDEQIATMLNKDVEQIRQPIEHNQPGQDLLKHVNPILLRAYLLSKKGKLSSDVYAEIDELFTIMQQGREQDDADFIALQKALENDLQEQLKKYQAGQITQSEIEDYVQDLHDWWYQEDGYEDWGDDDDQTVTASLDPAADALLRALKSRSVMQDDFPAAPALPESFKK
jgi:DNA-binding transcriptional regulator GbsR (MarR family)